jgi:hemerythrin
MTMDHVKDEDRYLEIVAFSRIFAHFRAFSRIFAHFRAFSRIFASRFRVLLSLV